MIRKVLTQGRHMQSMKALCQIV